MLRRPPQHHLAGVRAGTLLRRAEAAVELERRIGADDDAAAEEGARGRGVRPEFEGTVRCVCVDAYLGVAADVDGVGRMAGWAVDAGGEHDDIVRIDAGGG